MRIESIYIRGFGCLTERRYEFPSDKATLVIADNEAGKSTLAAAILAGLCGFPNEKRGKDRVILRDAYQPWNGDAYAVEMDITVGGRRLRIERDFAKGTFIVRDRDTGKDISAGYDSDLASHFLRLPREDFQRVAFISGKDTPSLGAMTNIQARLSALVDGSADETGAEVAMAALEGARYTLDTSLTIPVAVKRLEAAVEEKQRALKAMDASIEQAGEDAGRLEESKALHSELSASLNELDAEHQAARAAEEQASARQVEELRVELAVGQAEAKLGAIKQERQSAKTLATAIAFVGIAVALVGFGMLVLRVAGLAGSVACTMLGITGGAAGLVLATKAGTLKADEKARLEREIEDMRRGLPQNEKREARSSGDIEREQRELRQEIESLNGVIIDLEKRVGAAVDAYRRDYARTNEELRGSERELAKARRFGAAIEAAQQALREVAEGSRRRWASALNERAGQILALLSSDYDELLFDDSLSFTLRHVPDGRTLQKTEIDACLSTGAKDQVYLAVRLALCEELSCDGESIPALLDDPLMAADDGRFARGLRYLVETYAKDHQVLILSCSRQRHEAMIGEPWFADRVDQLSLQGIDR